MQRENNDTQRLEAFSDGIFAIAVTLLILDIHLPEHGSGDIRKELLSLWPSYIAYLISFITIGIYWVNHHYIFKFYTRTNHFFNLLNVFFLLWISFLPFPTSVLGHHLMDGTQQRMVVILYTFGLLMPALSWLFIWMYAHHAGLIDKRLTEDFLSHLHRQYAISAIFYIAAIGISAVSPIWGLSIAGGLTLVYLLPSRAPEYREESGKYEPR